MSLKNQIIIKILPWGDQYRIYIQILMNPHVWDSFKLNTIFVNSKIGQVVSMNNVLKKIMRQNIKL